MSHASSLEGHQPCPVMGEDSPSHQSAPSPGRWVLSPAPPRRHSRNHRWQSCGWKTLVWGSHRGSVSILPVERLDYHYGITQTSLTTPQNPIKANLGYPQGCDASFALLVQTRTSPHRNQGRKTAANTLTPRSCTPNQGSASCHYLQESCLWCHSSHSCEGPAAPCRCPAGTRG